MTTAEVWRARRRGATRAACVAVLLVGCAAIPTSGPIGSGEPVVVEPGSVVPLADGPVPGGTPEQIVNGFLSAGAAGFRDEFAVAREFLTPEAQAAWSPLKQVLVYSSSADSPTLALQDDGSVLVSLQIAAMVDETGHYQEADERIDEVFEMRLVDDEWRIDGLPDAVLLNEPNFDSQYRETTLYFPSPDATFLIPDVRYFPEQNIATSAVRGVLAGPSSWLRDVVVNPVPAGTRLSPDVVTITESTASVDLSAEVLSATPEERALLQAQLENVLLRLPGIRAVELSVAGAELTVERPVVLQRDPQPATGPVMISADRFVVLEQSTLAPVPTVGALEGLTPSRPAVDHRGALHVVLDGAGRLVRLGDGPDSHQVLLSGERLVPPSIDRWGWVWSGEAASRGVLTVVDSTGGAVDVDADWLDGRQVGLVLLARDGARALVLSRTSAGTAVDVAAVVRDSGGTPQRLEAPVTLGAVPDATVDAAWVGESTVAVLHGGPDDAQVLLIRIGGRSTTLPAVGGAVRVAAGRGERSIYLATDDGTLYVRSGTGWTAVASDVHDPTFPG